MIIPAPVDARLAPLAKAYEVPADDAEARAERKTLRRMDLREALK